MKQKVVIIGMGYVGYPLACAIARSAKNEVIGKEIDTTKIDKIKNRISPVEDKQAEEDIKTVNIEVSSDYSKVKDSDYVVICVPTPVNEEKEPDLTPVRKVATQITKFIRPGHIIILESTVNPGVCEEEVLPLLEQSGYIAGIDFDLIHCPERIDPANAHWNVYNIPRNIGGTSREGTKRAANFYRSFLHGQINEMTTLKTAEATKIVENTFRDINIAYVNELAKCFDRLGIDIMEVIKGASTKPFAFMPHYPGCGVGGHCIPVDPYYLISKARKVGFDHVFLKTAREINNGMNQYTVQKLITGLNEIGKPLKHTKIGILGVSYKANIGDTRESPSLEIIKILKTYNPDLLICDPYLNQEGLVDIDQVLSESEAVMVLTNHDQFLSIKKWNNVKLIIDGRNCLDIEEIKKQGIIYKGIGRN